jgi:type II secretory pathway pseudopilin PulG
VISLTTSSSQTMVQWLPLLMMMVGVAVLGVMAALMIRDSQRQRQSRQAADRAALDQTQAARRHLDQTRLRASELIEALQRRCSMLQDNILRLETRLALIERRLAEREKLADRQPLAGGSVTLQSSAPSIESRPIESARARQAQTNPLAKAVYELADAGRGAVEIARELNEQVGKVELILALRAIE